MEPARQYTQAWEHPRYGLTVQRNGTGELPGTRLSTDLASTSWNTVPANSGVRTDRRSPRSPGSAASAPIPSSSTCCPLHRMPVFEHVFDTQGKAGSGGYATLAP